MVCMGSPLRPCSCRAIAILDVVVAWVVPSTQLRCYYARLSRKSVGDLGRKNHPGSPRLGVTNQIHGGRTPGGGESKRPSEDSRRHAAKSLFVHSWYPKQPSSNGCLVKQPFVYVMIWNHPVETTIKNWLFEVPGGVVISTEKSVQCIPVKKNRETTMKWI